MPSKNHMLYVLSADKTMARHAGFSKVAHTWKNFLKGEPVFSDTFAHAANLNSHVTLQE